jgi:Tfp pilus assembly protein FimT
MRIETLRDSTGFTLQELVIAIALMVSAMAIVGPPTVRTLHRSTLQAAVHEITALHSLARGLAMQSGRPALLIHMTSQGKSKAATIGTLAVQADTIGTGVTTVRRTVLTRAEIVADRKVLCFDARGIPTQRTLLKADGSSVTCDAPDATFIVKVGSLADTIRYTPLGERMR